MPGEERLIAYERSLRQQADAQRTQQILSDALRNARELLSARQPDKAVTALETYELEHGQQAIESRMLALGRAHDLLLQARWSNASLAHIVRSAVEPYESQDAARFSILGPEVQVTSGSVIALAMMCNELCTNATKFGALTAPTGRIEIAWSIDEQNNRLRLTWSETGGPPVLPPTRQSFGTRLIETLAERIAAACFEDIRVISVRVRVEKLHALTGAESAGVEIERMR